MICANCGSEINAGAKFCTICGAAATEQPVVEDVVQAAEPVAEASVVAAPVYQEPVYTAPTQQQAKQKNKIPAEYSPLSPWAYFGLQILFSVPIVGFVFLIVFSFNKSNLNRRNFARSYWCGLIIALAIIIVAVVIALVFGLSLGSIRGFGGMGDMGAQMYSM